MGNAQFKAEMRKVFGEEGWELPEWVMELE